MRLSDFASDETPQLLIEDPKPAAARSPTAVAAAAAVPEAGGEFAALIRETSRQTGLSAQLIHAVIAAESNFNPAAISPKGALGLMQLMPDTAQRFGARAPLDAQQNLLAGALYLKWLGERFDHRLDLVLASYNAGEQAVVRAGWRVPEYAETQAYVQRILSRIACRSLSDCSAAPTSVR